MRSDQLIPFIFPSFGSCFAPQSNFYAPCSLRRFFGGSKTGNWALGSAAMGVSDDSSSWIVDTQHWFGVYEAGLRMGYKRRPFHVSGLTYTLDGVLKVDDEVRTNDQRRMRSCL